MQVEQPTAGGEYENIPEGEHQAVLVELLDLGWQMQEYEGVQKGMARRIQPMFQINALMEDGRRFGLRYKQLYVKWWDKGDQQSAWVKFLYDLYGASQAQKIVETALGQGEFDEQSLLGTNVMLDVFQKKIIGRDGSERVFDNVKEIARWRQNMGEVIAPLDYRSITQSPNYQPPQHSSFEPFPGDFETGEVWPEAAHAQQDRRAAQNNANTSSPHSPHSAPTAADSDGQTTMRTPPQTGEQMISGEQKTAILREAIRVWGQADYKSTTNTKIGNVGAMTAKNANDWIDWFAVEQDFQAPDIEDDDSDPFAD